MKTLALLLAFLSLNCFAEEENHDKGFSIGLGLGSMYTGIGGNLSLMSEYDLKYVSIGCVEYSSRFGSTCGFGAGWTKTDLFDFDSNKHGFGVYISLVGHESYVGYTSTTEGVKAYFHDDDIYGAGISYTYFMNGINQSGTTFGASIHATNASVESKYGGFLQVGYQF